MAITPGGRVGDARPLGKKPGPRRLTDYTREIAHALMRKGHSKSSAIAIARGAQKHWAKGGGHVSPKVRVGAAASIADQIRLDKQRRVGLSNTDETSTVSLSMASSQDGPSMTMKMSPEAVSIHRKLKAKGVPARTAAKMALRASRKSTSLSNPTEIETDLAYVGFGKLAAKLKAEGASDPDALAASIGRRKYGAKKFAKAAAKSTPLGKAKK